MPLGPARRRLRLRLEPYPLAFLQLPLSVAAPGATAVLIEEELDPRQYSIQSQVPVSSRPPQTGPSAFRRSQWSR